MVDRNKNLPQTLTLDHVSPATRLLEKRRQMFEVQEALDAQKEEFARREDAFRRREEGLRKKDLELQESLIKFNKFLQENESKRNRAIKRAADEKKQREIKESEIIKLRQQHEESVKESHALKEDVQKIMKYTRYLEMVQEIVPEDYPEIGDLVMRYKTLKVANEDLTNRQQQHEEENEQNRIKFANFTKERTNEILNFNNEIASLQKKLELGEVHVHQLQSEVDNTIRNTSDKTLELGQILMAVENLLLRCTHKHLILKHTERPNKESGNGHGSASGAKDGAALTETEQANRGKHSMTNLDVIADYMVDFKAIAEQGIEQKRLDRQQQNAKARPAGNATNPATTPAKQLGATATGATAPVQSNVSNQSPTSGNSGAAVS